MRQEPAVKVTPPARALLGRTPPTQTLTRWVAASLAVFGVCALIACGGANPASGPTTPTTNSGPQSSPTEIYDVDRLGVPKFVNVVYIDLSQIDPAAGTPLINQISKSCLI